ncbi:MAG: uncharacterized protein QOE31_2179 [Solirubrobacteraceae bacterium]|jgi:lysophospholipase L1-like esterase|nr:uncharacterized protein [Solirubrobacteraceae bacterium]
MVHRTVATPARRFCIAVASGLVLMTACSELARAALPPPTEPVVAVLSACSYAGAQVGFDARGFRPGERLTVEMMPTSDPMVGVPISARQLTADAAGQFIGLLDVPASTATGQVLRSVRVRGRPDTSGAAVLLASARLRTVSRSALIAPSGRLGRAGRTERWQLTGLPEGTRLWAHYRHGGAVADVAVATVAGPCGRARFTLPTLPAGHERAGAWQMWITTTRAFRPRRGEIHVQRRMTVAGSGRGARVTFAPMRSRLVPSDPRVVAPRTHPFAADATDIGVVHALFSRANGAPVRFFERVGDRLSALGSAQTPPGVDTILRDATTWSCSRQTRRFMAFANLGSFVATGVDTIRTPSCAGRFRIVATRHGAAGRAVVLRVVDRWGTGAITPRLCVAAPARRAVCRVLRFPRAVGVMSRRLRTTRPGLWRIDLRVTGTHTRAAIRVGAGSPAPKPAPVLLATGDSMMFGLDSFLADELAGTVEVRSDVRPGTGISKLSSDWLRIASDQVSAQRPRITVIMLGAADGYPMTTPAGGSAVPCCGLPWMAEYARRARVMMRSYLRDGRGRVYWLTIPIPRQVERIPIVLAINGVIRRAAVGVAGVTVVPLDSLFTPHGYRDVVRYHGATVRVRDVDGLHLNLQGQAIAAKAIARIMRATPGSGLRLPR